MKLVIAKGGIKRELDGPFELCGSIKDLRALSEQLRLATLEDSFSYGWVTIFAVPLPQCPSNTPPRKWEDFA